MKLGTTQPFAHSPLKEWDGGENWEQNTTHKNFLLRQKMKRENK